MSIKWFSKSLNGTVTIYETNITLNTVASRHFENAYSTLIGFDKASNHLLIKPLNKEESINGTYNSNDLHKISIKQSYGRINGKQIINNIHKVFPLDFSDNTNFKYRAEWDDANKYLKVFLGEEVS